MEPGAATQQQDGFISEKAAAAPQESLEDDLIHEMELGISRCSKQQQQQHISILEELEEAAVKFKADIDMMKKKIHRYPPSIRSIDEWYTVPKVVAIGPYHHGRTCLKHAENTKRVAAYYCIRYSNCTFKEMYCAVRSAVLEIDARNLYSEDVMEGIGGDKFVDMMFYDACFLVTYMLKWSGEECNGMLYDLIQSNARDIDHDLMLLENQIPWPVVDAIMKMYKALPLAKFIERWNDVPLLGRVNKVPTTHDDLDNWYEPSHLLGLLRFHFVRRRRTRTRVRGQMSIEGSVNSIELAQMGLKSIAGSVNAIELAEMGINLKANKTTGLADMDFTKKPIFFAELSMVPLCLNNLNASLLVNMAALELCTTPDFIDDEAEFEHSAVCSYLLVLCMLVHREEDVHQLRKRHILRGGAGLSDKKALDFFTSLQNLQHGRCYSRVMAQIESYRTKRKMRIKVYAFFYNNWKNILGVFSAIGVFIGILKATNSIKGAH